MGGTEKEKRHKRVRTHPTKTGCEAQGHLRCGACGDCCCSEETLGGYSETGQSQDEGHEVESRRQGQTVNQPRRSPLRLLPSTVVAHGSLHVRVASELLDGDHVGSVVQPIVDGRSAQFVGQCSRPRCTTSEHHQDRLIGRLSVRQRTSATGFEREWVQVVSTAIPADRSERRCRSGG